MIHPPFDVDDPRAVRIIEVLERDPLVQQRWKDHDRSFGYNTFPGYVAENVTKALDQLIGERVGMTFMDDVEDRWIQNDEGMHVLAAAVYELMKRERVFSTASKTRLSFWNSCRGRSRRWYRNGSETQRLLPRCSNRTGSNDVRRSYSE